MLSASRALRRATGRVRCFSAVKQPSLDKEMPGVPTGSFDHERKAPETKVSTLSNGIRVATQETYGPIATAGVFINAGSRNETHDTNGISHFLEHMAFKSTDKRSALRLMRDIDEKGAIVGGQSSRDCIMYSGEVLRTDIESIVEALAETVLTPKLAPWELDDQRKVLSYELETLEDNVQQLVTEFVHAAAYGESSPLGRSLWCPQRNLNKISAADIKNFLGSTFLNKNMVIAAAGVDHDEFVKLAETHFTQTPNYTQAESTPTVEAEYHGGIKIVEADTEFTHVALAFNPGGWHSDDLMDICTMHFLLGGGGSFSAGGPGKGMYSRLYLNILNRYGWVDSAIALNTLYDNNGLFGVYGSAEPSMAGELVYAISDELLALKSGNLTTEEVDRAKAQTKSSLLMKLEERQVLFEDIGRQMLVYGQRKSPEEWSAKIDAVTPESIKKCAEKLLSTTPSVAAFGDATQIPSFETIAKKFQ